MTFNGFPIFSSNLDVVLADDSSVPAMSPIAITKELVLDFIQFIAAAHDDANGRASSDSGMGGYGGCVLV